MQYQLVDKPIIPTSSKRRSKTSKKRTQVEEKREELQESFSVEELIEMGFYDLKQKQKPFGVECFSFVSEQMDADFYELLKVTKYKIRVLLPDGANPSKIQKFNPSESRYSEEGYYWNYQIYGAARFWVFLDFLSRLIQLPYWDKYEFVPLYWKPEDQPVMELLNQKITLVNQGKFDLPIPLPQLISPEKMEFQIKKTMQLRISGGQFIEINNKAKISYLRHHHTPYDYLWQTGKISVDEARIFCNELVEQKYPELFDE